VSTFGTIARRSGWWLPLLGLAALAGTLGSLALPAVLGAAVDAIVAGKADSRWLVVAVLLILLGILVDLVEVYAGTACVAGTTAWLRTKVVRHLLAIGPRADQETGDLVSRVSANAADAAQAGPTVTTIGLAALPPAGSLILLAVIDGWLAVAFLLGVALVAVVLRTFTRRTADIVVAYQQIQGRIAGRLAEAMTGIRTITAAGTAERESRRILEALPELSEKGRKTWEVLAGSSAQAAVVGPLVLVAVLATGGWELAAGRISAGELFAASQYAAIGAGLGGLTGVFGQLARVRAGVRRLDDVFRIPATEYGDVVLPDGQGRLEFRGATVRSDGCTLLDGVDLVVPAGKATAVVGRSGAGKSILAALAARLRDPDEGEVLLDGVALPRLRRDALRDAVSCAFERPVLVGETVADAIALGLDERRVESAARATHAHDFVTRLPAGYQTLLAEAPMSGGEAQRLGLARAWHASRVLVLDDATSSLDMVTEMQIGQTLTDAADGRTRLIVTHRAATAARADLVVWLENGRVRAVGTHDRLWSQRAYREVFG
jgi:ATP-binding cassette subfamily B protein